ncbi:MAG: hypothetical protein ACSHW0_08965 [Thalassotalea sp.]
MKNLKKKLACVLLLNAFHSSLVFAEQETSIDVSTMPDAQVFASFTESLPAVVNYFSKAEKQTIIDFYLEQYGTALSQETKRQRLTLTFHQNGNEIRVVISEQNNKRQVDVLVTKI